MVWEILLSASTIAFALKLATPVLLSGLGETISERSGILNVGLEGYMVCGALFAYMVTLNTNSLFLGVLCAALSGLALSVVHSILSIYLGLDQIVSGIGINIFAHGLTTLLYSLTPQIFLPVYFCNISIPGLGSLPYVGDIIFNQDLLVYIGLILVASLYIVLKKTSFGMKVNAVGENAWVSDVSGVNVYLTRFVCTAIAGALSGLSGAYLTTSLSTIFQCEMSSGRGFVAIALVIAARWNPLLLFVFSWLFGYINSAQLRLQVTGALPVPWPFLQALPYIFTLIVLGIFRARPPRELCVPYKKS
jgi:simple sugar transport system permease protein